MVKIDLTRGGNVLHERLVEEYEVKGVPTVVFLGADGRERRGLRLVDYLPPEQFLQRMEAVKDAATGRRKDDGESQVLSERTTGEALKALP
jgi:thiol:disulfide interchange protein DsbD